MIENIPLSALQHYLYCPRQCALIHVEKVWVENKFTAEGRIMHQRVDSKHESRRAGLSQSLSVPLRSDRLGLYGVADIVEMHPGADGNEAPYPVEYKRGSPKINDCDRVQLCAQALCLEEMLGIKIIEGAIFYGKPRRRETVTFNAELRAKVKEIARLLHQMIDAAETPPAEKGKKCQGCSLVGTCMPGIRKSAVELYLRRGLES